MKRMMKQPLAALVLFALAASTVLRFHSWRATERATDLDYSLYESARKLLHIQSNSDYDQARKLLHLKTSSYYDQVVHQLKAQGHQPGTPEFETIMRSKMFEYEEGLVTQIAHEHISNSWSDRMYQRILRDGNITPGTVRFDRVWKRKTERRERNEKAKADRNRIALEAKQLQGERKLMITDETQEKRKARPNKRTGRLILTKPKKVLLQDEPRGVKEKLADEIEEEPNIDEDNQPLAICNRPADVGSTEDFASLQKYSNCSEITKDKPIMLLEGLGSHGRTGNNLIEFLHAIQEAQDTGTQLGVMYRSWAMNLLLKMWMAIDSDDWQAQFERTFCVKIFQHDQDLKEWDVIHKSTKELLLYRTNIPLDDYIASQEYYLRTLFRNYNSGEGHGIWGEPVNDMCSGIDAVFGEERRSAMYSVIHSRSLEGAPGLRLLGTVAEKSGCDPVAALEMKPDYIKAVLEPLGMMKHPIVFISDGQNSAVLERLLADPDIGPMIQTVPEEASWIGGDLTLAIMSNAFIGNPASTFTGFIARSRLALGFGHNYLFRAKDKNGEWKDVCGDNCVFDRKILNNMS